MLGFYMSFIKILLKCKTESKAEGKAELLIRLLSRRFGPLPRWAEARVSKAKSVQIEEWADAVLDASSLTEVLGAPGSAVKKQSP